MWKDEILEEIYKIREEHAKAFNYDLKAICNNLRKRQAESGRKIEKFFLNLFVSHITNTIGADS
jgi:hypothetical protein